MPQFNHGTHFDVFSHQGPALHFYGANGFPTKVYRSFINCLQHEFSVSSLHNRATWPNQPMPKKINWQIYADDLIHFLSGHTAKPVIGVGHSLGATSTVLAAIKRPDLFKCLVLIEPAMTSPLVSKLLPLVPFRLAQRVQPIKYTVEKTETWSSSESFYQDLKQRRVFKRIDDIDLQHMAEQSLRQASEQHAHLKFPKMWEAKNYASAPNIYRQLKDLTMPVIAIRGKPSAYFSDKSWQKWRALSPKTIFKEDANYGHLFPLESPEKCSELIVSGLMELGYTGYTSC